MGSDSTAGSQRFLYVGSSSTLFEALDSYLEAVDARTTLLQAETASEAAELACETLLDGIVAQYDLPDCDGIDAILECVDPPVRALTVLVSETSTSALVERAYEAGIDEYVHYTGAEKLPVLEHRLDRHVDDGEGSGDDHRSLQHLDALAATTSDAIISIDESSVIRYVNPAVTDVFGYEPEELVGEPLTTLMPDDLSGRHRERYQQYLETGERTFEWDDVQIPGRHRDGHELPLSVSFAEFTVDGERYFTGIVRDIQERKRLQAERDLYHEATQRILRSDSFEEGLDTALDVVGSAMDWEYGEAWTRSDDGRLERAATEYVASGESSRFEELAATTPVEVDEGLVGRVWASGEPEWVADVDDGFERGRAAVEADLRAALGVPVVSEGTVVAVMVFFLTERREPDQAMLDATTTIAADLGRLMERLEAETAVREQQRLQDRILETSPVGIAITDSEGNFEYLNERAAELLTGDPSAEQAVAADADVDLVTFDGRSVPDEDQPYQRVVEEGESVSGEAEVTIRGETRWLVVSGAPLHDEDGTLSSGVFSFRDVTERKERERRLQTTDAVMETVGDGVYALDEAGRFVAVNQAYTDLVGYDRAELLGRPADEFIDTGVTEAAGDLAAEILAGDRNDATLETVVTTKSGEQRPVEVRLSLFDLGEEYGRAGVVRDITERRRREERLAQLNEVGQALAGAETDSEVGTIVVEGAQETLDLPLATVEFYDEEMGELVPGPRTPELESLAGSAALFDSEWNLPWRVYAESEERVIDDLREEPSVEADETALRSVIVAPVGSHGVFIAGATEAGAFSDADVTTARILVANAVAALDRVDREQELREKSTRLAEHNESLERVNRLNGVIRGLTQKLTQASTREEIETAVCEELAATDPYSFAWVGQRRAEHEGVTPTAQAGDDSGYLDALSGEGDSPSVDEQLSGRVIQTGDRAVENNLQADPPFDRWRQEALRRSYRAAVAVPLQYRETTYGTLNLYADESGVFDEMEAAVFSELGTMIGYAINAIERKKALVSEESVELTFGVDDSSIPAIEFVQETGGSFEFESLVEQSDGSFRVFFTISGADLETVYEFADLSEEILDVTLLSERQSGMYYEASVTDGSFLARLVSYGAHPTAMSVGPEGGRLTVELPQSGEVRSFVRMFLDTYDGSELIARVHRDRPVQTLAEFEANYRDRLTERQTEVLQTAYFSGFFEWPRDTSGAELASLLDVSQPTVSRHIRTGERKLFSLLFDEG
ncbi:PAS domain S-box protein [Halomarina salina]|uniref:PAS domain S-box protein n=1 Tax=Halomarina salina TaxID=1872699 RepID=A0ABD5RJ76_9EURY|nr:PAS domain S-box protein [Halomarina salina]